MSVLRTCLRTPRSILYEAYSLLSWLRDVLIRFEEGADVDCLAAPKVSVDRPVEGKLERAAVEVPSHVSVIAISPLGRGCSLQDVGVGRHFGRCTWARARFGRLCYAVALT